MNIKSQVKALIGETRAGHCKDHRYHFTGKYSVSPPHLQNCFQCLPLEEITNKKTDPYIPPRGQARYI